MKDLNGIKTAIRFSELFRGVDPDNMEKSFAKSFKRGERVEEMQDGIDCVGIVIEGSLEVRPGDKSSVSILKKGGEFGICNIFVNEKMPTVLTAKVSSRVLFLPKEAFARLLSSDAGLMYRYIRLCNEKMLYLAKRLRLISITDCTERLYYYLLTSQTDGIVKLRVTKEELARQLGISRSSLFRAFSALSEAGRILEAGGHIILADRVCSN